MIGQSLKGAERSRTKGPSGIVFGIESVKLGGLGEEVSISMRI